MNAPAQEPLLAARLRAAVLAILVMVLAGMEVELLLLKHTEEIWQLVPVVLLPLALATLAWHGLSRGTAALRAFQGLMALSLASGAAGVILHYRANVIDSGESDPSLSGLALYAAAAVGSIPALAPGTMVQIGLLGLVFAYRHPRFNKSSEPNPSPEA